MGQVVRSLKVAVIGFGGIGGVVAGLACRAGHEVSVVLGGHRLREAVDSYTLDSGFYGRFDFVPNLVSQIPSDVDVVILAVKWHRSDQSWLEFLEVKCSGVVVCLLNGIGFHERINRLSDTRFCVATIGFIEARKLNNGMFKHISDRPPIIQYSCKGLEECDKQTLDFFWKSICFESVVLRCSREVIWSKLSRLDVIASMTSAYQCPIGSIREDRVLRIEMLALIEEVVAVAFLDGVLISANEVIDTIDSLPFDLTTSLQHDIALGLESELEVITGGVITKAKEFGLDLPVHLAIYKKILGLHEKILLTKCGEGES